MEQKHNKEQNDELLPSAHHHAKPMLADGSFSLSDERVLALSWKQPFASAMLVGKVETRSWNTNYRGLVLICSSQKYYKPDEIEFISGKKLSHKMWLKMQKLLTRETPNFEPSSALAIAQLVDCRPMKIEDEEQTFVKFNPNLYCHFYENVRKIQPFFWKGCQGWKELSQEVKASIVFL